MANTFAVGKRAWGVCDRCGFRALLSKLKSEAVAGRRLTNRVCPSCFDPDHPQNWQGRYPVYDPQALRDPRPDNGIQASRDIDWGWRPVRGMTATAEVGTVQVIT